MISSRAHLRDRQGFRVLRRTSEVAIVGAIITLVAKSLPSKKYSCLND